LSPKVALSIAMAMHELSTNAVKYGALSNAAGRVDVRWAVVAATDGAGERLRIEWRERDGPAVTQPARRGFGSRLVERGLAGELGGTARLHFEVTGVMCEIEAPLEMYAGEAV
jgi:two-component sensor histidine kinase